MKKVLLIFVSLGILSCSSDDNKESEVPLTGNWKLIGSNTYGNENQLTKCDKELNYIEFKTGNEVVERKGVSDQSNESGCTQTTTIGSYEIEISDNELILTNNKSSRRHYFITELNATSLKLKIFKRSYLNNQNIWVDEGIPEINRTVFSYSK